MKSYLLFILLIAFELTSFSQETKFWYDASVNRTSRKIITVAKAAPGTVTQSENQQVPLQEQMGEFAVFSPGSVFLTGR